MLVLSWPHPAGSMTGHPAFADPQGRPGAASRSKMAQPKAAKMAIIRDNYPRPGTSLSAESPSLGVSSRERGAAVATPLRDMRPSIALP